MKILFGLNNDVIQSNLLNVIRQEGINLDFDEERDRVFSKDLIVEKIKYNIDTQEPRYDIVIISERLEGEYDLIEIVRYLTRNNVRPIIILGNRSDNDPLIHALIKRKVYDFLYGKLKLQDIFNCIITPRRYEDIEHLVDIDAEEYKVQGKGISDYAGDTNISSQDNIIEAEPIMSTPPKGSPIKPPELPKFPGNKVPTLNFPNLKGIKDAITPKTPDMIQPNAPERVVVQQQYVAQLPTDYKKNIAIYSNHQVGKSFVACNLAATFAAQGKKTVLVDLDFKNKSQFYYFDMSKLEARAKNPNDLNLISKVFEADIDDVQRLTDELFSPMKNLYVVTSHPDLDVRDYDIDYLYRVYGMLKTMFDVVIYDLPGKCSEDYLKLLMTQVEDIIVLTNQNCSILDRTEKDLRDVMTGYFVNNKVSLLINQFIEHKEMTKTSIKEHLSIIEGKSKNIEINFKNVFVIPNNYAALVESVAKGKPAVMFDDELRRVFEDIAYKYYPDVNPRRRG